MSGILQNESSLFSTYELLQEKLNKFDSQKQFIIFLRILDYEKLKLLADKILKKKKQWIQLKIFIFFCIIIKIKFLFHNLNRILNRNSFIPQMISQQLNYNSNFGICHSPQNNTYSFKEMKENSKYWHSKDFHYALQNCSHSLVNDPDYNFYIYEWRKEEKAPIVQTLQLNKVTAFNDDHEQVGIKFTVSVEKIEKRLSELNNLSKEEVLLVGKTLLEGHQAIQNKLKATSVCLDHIGINSEGIIKVWVNKEFVKNQILGEVLTREEEIVQRIIQILKMIGKTKIDDFIRYVEMGLNKNREHKIKSGFCFLKNIIKNYTQCLKIILPKKIASKKCIGEHLEVRRRNQKSFSIGQSKMSFKQTEKNILFPGKEMQCAQMFNNQVSRRNKKCSNTNNSQILERKTENNLSKIKREERRKPSITINGSQIINVFQDDYALYKMRHSKSGNLKSSESTNSFEKSKSKSSKKYSDRPEQLTVKQINSLLQRSKNSSLASVKILEQSLQQLDESIRKSEKKKEKNQINSNQGDGEQKNRKQADCSEKQEFLRLKNHQEKNNFWETRKTQNNINKVRSFETLLTNPSKKMREKSNDPLRVNLKGIVKKEDIQKRQNSLFPSSKGSFFSKNEIKIKESFLKVEKNDVKSRKYSHAEPNQDHNILKARKYSYPQNMIADNSIHLWSNTKTKKIEDLKSLKEIESFDNSEINSSLSLLNKDESEQKRHNRNGSQIGESKKICSQSLLGIKEPNLLVPRGGLEMEKDLETIMNLNEDKIKNNRWIKKISTLLGADCDAQLKESISYGPEIKVRCEVQLPELMKHGREIGESVIANDMNI